VPTKAAAKIVVENVNVVLQPLRAGEALPSRYA
jgi:hypothetical protein